MFNPIKDLVCEKTGVNETLLLSYQEIERKDDVTTAELITDVLLDFDLLEFVKRGLLSICTDGALQSCADSLTCLNTNSVCVLHNTHRICENVLVNLKKLNPDLYAEFEKIDRFMVLSKRKHSLSHMKKYKIPPSQRSVNTYLKVS